MELSVKILTKHMFLLFIDTMYGPKVMRPQIMINGEPPQCHIQ